MRSAILSLIGAVTLGGAANAAVVVHTSSFISDPNHYVDFENFGSSAIFNLGNPFLYTYAGNSFSSDNLLMTYFPSANPNNGIVNNAFYTGFNTVREGTGSWYLNGGSYGYTEIALLNGGDMSAIQFLAGSGSGLPSFQYQLLDNGAVVATGQVSGLQAYQGNTFGFDGITFDKVRLQSGPQTSFVHDGRDVLSLDNLSVLKAVSPVPEPSVWLMMITGSMLAGMTIRTRRRMSGAHRIGPADQLRST